MSGSAVHASCPESVPQHFFHSCGPRRLREEEEKQEGPDAELSSVLVGGEREKKGGEGHTILLCTLKRAPFPVFFQTNKEQTRLVLLHARHKRVIVTISLLAFLVFFLSPRKRGRLNSEGRNPFRNDSAIMIDRFLSELRSR